MRKIYSSISELVGKTPIMELRNIEKKLNLNVKLLAKLEYMNPAGSVKDRVAKAMIDEAEAQGKLKAGYTLIEPTSGNTGIGLAAIAASRGYRMILTMPDTMSVERRNILKAYGAEVVLTEGSRGMAGAIDKANELAGEIENSFIPAQFSNMANPKAHYDTTGPEIWSDTDGDIDIFMSAFGTGGTVSGTSKYLKEKNPNIKVIGLEPETSPFITQGHAGAHKIQGIGAGFKPDTLDLGACDEVITMDNERPFQYAKMMAKEEGILVGISSGAIIAGAVDIAGKEENFGKTIVIILPDGGDRYYSTPLFV